MNTDHPDGAHNPDTRTDPGPEHPRPLHACRPGDVVTTPAGETVVVLNPASPQPNPTRSGQTPTDPDPDLVQHPDQAPDPVQNLVEVYATHRVVQLPADEVVTPLTDTHEQRVALRTAVEALALRRQLDARTQDALRADHARVLADIRAFAIERHLEGDLYREHLNAFLVRFRMPPYAPRLRVRFTISGSYDVDGGPGDVPDAIAAARAGLLVRTEDIDDLIPGTATLDVRIGEVTALDTGLPHGHALPGASSTPDALVDQDGAAGRPDHRPGAEQPA